MSDEMDSDVERRTKRAFDDSVAGLDAATRSRLTQARHRALEELPTQRGRSFRSSLLPASALAATALVAVLVVWQSPRGPENLETEQLGDLEILLGEEDLEMLDEELEFYSWLEEQPEFSNVGDSVG